MNHLLEILNLVQASLAGDRKKGIAYARQLAEKLESDGDQKSAERIRRIVNTKAASVSAAAGVAVAERMPVDNESRFDLADERLIRPGEAEVFLSPQLRDEVEEFLQYVEASDRLIADGVGVSSSLLMYGPPGCGKTELAGLIASRLELPLITARIDSLISSFLGSTAKNLRLLFEHAASKPCVLFLDEFDAVAKLRDDQQELGELKRVVVSLLQNIDSVKGETVLLAATNHEHLLDPAIWRRFAYRLKIDLPSTEVRERLFEKFLGRAFPSRAARRFVEASEGLSGSDIRDVCDGARRAAIVSNHLEVTEVDVLRRLLFRTVGADSPSIPDLIARAKEKFPDVYTHRVLAEAFGMSAGNVTHILKRKQKLEHV